MATPKTVTMPDVTGLTVSTAVQTLNRKNISSSSIEYHDYNTGAKLDKDKIPSREVLYQDPQAGTSVDGTVILYVSVATASSNLQSSSSSTTHSSSTSSSTDSTTSSTETSTEATHTELQ